jgi:hypothetical protein
MHRSGLVVGAMGAWLLAATPAFARTQCDLTFDLESWSIFYKHGQGRGVVDCDNGQRAHVVIETRGGGVTFGASRIVDGSGEFSLVADIEEIFGDYAAAEAHAGMGPSTHAQVVTKGPISLALSGTGNGVDVGFAFGRFTLRPGAPPRRHADRPPPEPEPELRTRDDRPVDDPGMPDGGRIDDEDLPSGDPAPPDGY